MISFSCGYFKLRIFYQNMKELLIPLILFLTSNCHSIKTPLEMDLFVHEQHSSSLIGKIENAKELVRKNSFLIQNPSIRNRFLEIEAENHSKQICAVTTYYLLLKYSGAENLGSFEDYYIREINKGSIIETKSTEIPFGFALIAGSSAVNLLLKDYKFKKMKFKIQRHEGLSGLEKFIKTKYNFAIVGKTNGDYSHYFLIFKDKDKDKDNVIRIADAANPDRYGEVLESQINTIAWLEL